MRTVRWYCLGRDGGFRGWYDSQAAEIQGRIEFALELLSALPDWKKSPFYEEMRGRCEGLGEIRVNAGNAHYRLLGCDGPGKQAFTILCWFRKETNADYGRECPKARERKEGVLRDASRTEVWPFDEEATPS